jgi:hypothetical protein
VDRAHAWPAGRALSGLIAAALLAGCGSGPPASDPASVAKATQEAAQAAAKSDSDGACGHLTHTAQTQIVLQTGGRLGDVDCSQAVGRALLFLDKAARDRIRSLQATDIRIDGDSASVVMRSPPGDPAPMTVPMSLKLEGGDWKINGFGEPAGVPGF